MRGPLILLLYSALFNHIPHFPADLNPQTLTNNSKLVFETINLLEDFSIGTAPAFTIVSMEEYIREILSNSTLARATLLPPSFMLTLSFRPDNNTALKLVSSMITSPLTDSSNDNLLLTPDIETETASPDQTNRNSSRTGPESEEFASLLLSTAATYLHRDRFFTVWEEVSVSARHSLVFFVTNGSVSSCLDGDYRPANPGVVFWEEFGLFKSNKRQIVQFSEYLHSMSSLVSVWCV